VVRLLRSAVEWRVSLDDLVDGLLLAGLLLRLDLYLFSSVVAAGVMLEPPASFFAVWIGGLELGDTGRVRARLGARGTQGGSREFAACMSGNRDVGGRGYVVVELDRVCRARSGADGGVQSCCWPSRRG